MSNLRPASSTVRIAASRRRFPRSGGRLAVASVLAVLPMMACAVDVPTDDDAMAGAGGAVGASGAATAGGVAGVAGLPSTAGSGGIAGAPAQGGAGAPAAGGSAGATSPTGQAGETGTAGDTGDAGGAGQDQTAGGAGAGADDTLGDDDSASTGDPNPSGMPEPGAGGVARPAGAAGNLKVLPWAGYKGAMTYTFDDANSTQINNEQQLLGLEVPFTFYLQTGKQEAGNAFFQRALDQGHELGNHTQNHGSGAADQDVNQAQSFIESNYGITAYTMAAPNGNNGNYNSIATQLFIIDRGVADSLIGPDDNAAVLNLPTYIPPTGAGTAQLNPKADAAQSQGKWQTVCIHGFSGGNDGAYQPIDLNGFVQHVQYVKDKGDVWIGSMKDVGGYWLGRKAVAAATAMGDGVYKWTLPNNFPPGQYVRVTVDGGTLSQDGAALPWNDHGFYEVALDPGEVTLTP